jgi:hypothetical protein
MSDRSGHSVLLDVFDALELARYPAEARAIGQVTWDLRLNKTGAR